MFPNYISLSFTMSGEKKNLLTYWYCFQWTFKWINGNYIILLLRIHQEELQVFAGKSYIWVGLLAVATLPLTWISSLKTEAWISGYNPVYSQTDPGFTFPVESAHLMAKGHYKCLKQVWQYFEEMVKLLIFSHSTLLEMTHEKHLTHGNSEKLIVYPPHLKMGLRVKGSPSNNLFQ